MYPTEYIEVRIHRKEARLAKRSPKGSAQSSSRKSGDFIRAARVILSNPPPKTEGRPMMAKRKVTAAVIIEATSRALGRLRRTRIARAPRKGADTVPTMAA